MKSTGTTAGIDYCGLDNGKSFNTIRTAEVRICNKVVERRVVRLRIGMRESAKINSATRIHRHRSANQCIFGYYAK